MKKLGKGAIVAIVLVVIAIIIGAFSIGQYNGLVTSRESVDSAYADVDTQLQRRYDLIPNLVATAKQYAEHEENIFTEIANARTAAQNAASPEAQSEANANLDEVLNRNINILVERYPDLKANENFKELQVQLEGTENRISVARKNYNDAVQSYNVKVTRFPGNIFAGMFGFDKAEFFTATEGAENAPDVGDLFNQ